MNRILTLLIAVALVFGLASCAPGFTPEAQYSLTEEELNVEGVVKAFTQYETVAFEGTIEVPDNETLIIPAGKTLVGYGSDKSIIDGNVAGTADMPVVTISGGTLDHVTVRFDPDDEFDAWPSGRTSAVTFAQGENGGKLLGSVITNARNGVYANQARNIEIRDCEIYHNRTGIQFANTVTGSIKNNNIHDNETIGILVQYLSAFDYGEQDKLVLDNAYSGNWYANINIRDSQYKDYVDFSADYSAVTEGTTGEHSSTNRAEFFNGGTVTKPANSFKGDVVVAEGWNVDSAI